MHLRAAAPPWPDFAHVARQSLVHGRKAGLLTSAVPSAIQVRDQPASPPRQIASCLLCNAFNPKAPIYFLAIFHVVLSLRLPLSTLLIYGV